MKGTEERERAAEVLEQHQNQAPRVPSAPPPPLPWWRRAAFRFWPDVRFAFRLLARGPIFAVSAILSLALCIGANTALFTIFKAVFLAPLGVVRPDRLVTMFTLDTGNPGFHAFSYPNYLDFKQSARSVFQNVAAYAPMTVHVDTRQGAERMIGGVATGDFFEVLGVNAQIGGLLRPEDELPPETQTTAEPQPVVLSHGLWERRFDRASDIVGKPVQINGQLFSVRGVLPRTFKGLMAGRSIDLWVPFRPDSAILPQPQWLRSRRVLMIYPVARLVDGVGLRAAAHQVQGISEQLARQYPMANDHRTAELIPLEEATIHPSRRGFFLRVSALLAAATGTLLLITCANLTNLLLLRGRARRREMAVRLSLGAQPGALARQLLTESLLLAAIGGALGFLLAIWARDWMWAHRPGFLTQDSLDLSLDGTVLGFNLLISLGTAILVGLAPAIQILQPDLTRELKDRTGRDTTGAEAGGFRWRDILVIAQVSLSLVALVWAGLFLRSWQNAERVDPGFETRRLLLLRLDPGAQGYSPLHSTEYYSRVVERVSALPGVRSAALAANQPFAEEGLFRSVYLPEQDRNRGKFVLSNIVGPRYFETTDIVILRGRNFTLADTAAGPMAAIVNQAMAKQFWPNEDALGRRFHLWGDPREYQVAGIARDCVVHELAEPPQPVLYLPVGQHFAPSMTLHVRTADDPDLLWGQVHDAVQEVDSSLPLNEMTTIRKVLADSLWSARMVASLLTTFGLLGLILAAIGLYGVTAFSVTERTHEFGIRVAMGAAPLDMTELVLRHAVMLLVPGLAVGLVAAAAFTPAISNLLVGVAAADWRIYGATCLLLAFVTLVASYLPVRRAIHRPALDALRHP